MKFAVYYVPREGEFYEFGSRVLGYDIRRRRLIADRPAWIRKQWVENARQYGFHLTLTDAVDLDPERLSGIERGLDDILRCFSAADRYLLGLVESPVTFWQPNLAVIPALPDSLVTTLHTALVCTLQIQGTGSAYSDRIATNPDSLYAWPKNRVQKLKLFLSPYVLDDFEPHFTLFDGYDEHEQSTIAERLNASLGQSHGTIEMKSVCLVIQKEPGVCFEIYREFPLDEGKGA